MRFFGWFRNFMPCYLCCTTITHQTFFPMRYFLSLLFTACYFVAQAQWVTGDLTTNRIKTLSTNNGLFFTDGISGKFNAPAGITAQHLLNSAGLFIGALDSFGTLHIAGAFKNNSGFSPGELYPVTGQPGGFLPDKVWKVTSGEIETFLADIADNGVIDNPQDGVMAWPSRGNRFFSDYNNGANLPFTSQSLAGMFDTDGDGDYDPDSGDYPSLEVRFCSQDRYPDEMNWYVFHNNGTYPAASSDLKLEVQVQQFAYACTANGPLGNTIFTRIKIINRSVVPFDSCFVGFANDFKIGNGAREFVGTDPQRQLIYAYNGDVADAGLSNIGMTVLRGPLRPAKTATNLDTLVEISLRHAVPFDPTQNISAEGFYRLLSGRNPDGSLVAGNGLPYTDSPLDPNGISEASAGNTPGNRAIMASFGSFFLKPGSVNELILAHTFTDANAGANPYPNVAQLFEYSDQLRDFFNNCFDPAQQQELCSAPVSTYALANDAALRVQPNPNKGRFQITLDGDDEIQRVTLFNALGGVVKTVEPQARNLTFDDLSLSPGVYVAQVETAARKIHIRKIIVCFTGD